MTPPMPPPIRLAPDGALALAALIDLFGQPAPISPGLAAELSPVDDSPVQTLARLMARRRQHGPPAAATGRSPAARFLRRQHRRWRITQGTVPAAADLARAGRRAIRRGLGWPDADPFVVGCWIAFWAQNDPALRRDLLALQTVAVARRIMTTPLLAQDAQRFWR